MSRITAKRGPMRLGQERQESRPIRVSSRVQSHIERVESNAWTSISKKEITRVDK